MAKKRNVPELRIKGNMEEWKRSTFLDLFDLSIPNNTLSRADLNYDKGTIKNVHYGDVLINFGAITDASDRRLPFITVGKLNSYKDCLLKNGDIIIADTAEDETVGKATEIIGADTSYIVSGLHTIVCRPKIAFQMYFLGNYINSNSFHLQLLPLMQGTKVLSLSRSNLTMTYLSYPDSHKEQAQIGIFLKNIDSLIALHQRKYDKLCLLKKSMLEKMFPKEGADIPEIRFIGFSGKWELRYLIDNIDKIIDFRGRTPKKLGLDWSDTGYLALSALNVKNGYIDFEVDAHYGNQELYDKWMFGNELHKNQILFTTEAPMGNVAQIPDNNKYILSQRTIAFEVNQKLITEDYLSIVFSLPAIKKKLNSLSSGGTAKGISQKSLARFEIFVPKDIREQEKIGRYFKSLDTIISLHQRELDKLKNIKKAFLEKMFI